MPGMGLFRGIDGPSSNTTELGARRPPAQEERRRATREGLMAHGTLACARCDAPVAAGPEPLAITAGLSCPFCAHSGTVGDFLSLRTPTRPARVVVRVSLRHASGP